MKIDISLLRNQIQSYEKKISDLSIIINNLETSNKEMQIKSLQDKELLQNSKIELQTVTAQLIESNKELKRLNDLLLSLQNKVKTWQTIGLIAVIIAAIEGLLLILSS